MRARRRNEGIEREKGRRVVSLAWCCSALVCGVLVCFGCACFVRVRCVPCGVSSVLFVCCAVLFVVLCGVGWCCVKRESTFGFQVSCEQRTIWADRCRDAWFMEVQGSGVPRVKKGACSGIPCSRSVLWCCNPVVCVFFAWVAMWRCRSSHFICWQGRSLSYRGRAAATLVRCLVEYQPPAPVSEGLR